MDQKESKYSEYEVVKQLSAKQDIKFKGKQIQELRIDGRGDVGIKSRGKIDFLVTYHGYAHIFVNKFS